MNETIINESVKNPGFFKGFLYGIGTTITTILIILSPIIAFILKDTSFKELKTYIYEAEKNKEIVEKNKEIFEELNNKIKKLEEINNSYKVNADIAKEQHENIEKINTLINDYNKKYGEISYYNSADYNKYTLARYEYNAILEQIRIYKLEEHFVFFTKKVYNVMSEPKN